MAYLVHGALLFIVLSLVYVIKIAIRNNRKQRWFEALNTKIPVAPNKNPIVGHLWSIYTEPYSCLVVHDLHTKLGPTFEFLTTDQINVATTDLDLIKTINLDEPLDHVDRVQVDAPMSELREDQIGMAPKEQWLRLRRVVAPALSNRMIKSDTVQNELCDVVDRFLTSVDRRFRRAQGDLWLELDTEDLFHRYALTVVLSCFYREPYRINFDLQRDKLQRQFSEGLIAIISPYLKVCLAFPILMYPLEFLVKFTSQGRSRKVLEGYVKNQTKRNLKVKQAEVEAEKLGKTINKVKREYTVVDHIIDQFHNGKLNQKEYINTSLFLFHAAHKTSADSISRLVYLLAHNQEKQDKLRKSVLQDGEESEYLAWSINEALRLYPPAPIGSARIISRDIVTDLGVIPKGSHVISSTFTIHRLKEYWGDDAEDFRPERWANSKSFHPCQFMAFGVGRRNCPGGNFAVQEIKMLMNKMLRRYRFLPSPKTSGFIKFQSPLLIFSITEKPVYVRLVKIED